MAANWCATGWPKLQAHEKRRKKIWRLRRYRSAKWKLNCELFYTDLRKFSAQSYKCRALLIPPTPAPEAPECVFVAYAYKIPAGGHGWGF